MLLSLRDLRLELGDFRVESLDLRRLMVVIGPKSFEGRRQLIDFPFSIRCKCLRCLEKLYDFVMILTLLSDLSLKVFNLGESRFGLVLCSIGST